jgi:hypothetical protein
MSRLAAKPTGLFPVSRRGVLAGFVSAASTSLPARAAEDEAQVAAGFRRIPKALWVWRMRLAEAGKLGIFMRRWGFETALLSIPAPDREALRNTAPGTRTALEALHNEGISVVLASGDAAWLTRGNSERTALPDVLQRLIELAGRSSAVEGIALDVEPHVLPEWRSPARPHLARAFVDLVERCHAQTSASRLRLSAAVHPALAQTPDLAAPERSAFAALLGSADEIITMAYRNEPGRATAFAGGLIDELARSRVPWRFGITTQDSPNAATISYFGFAVGQFQAAMTDLNRRMAGSRAGYAYRGIAVQHYATVEPLLS